MTSEVPYLPLPPDSGEVRYAHGPDSARHPDVPAGTVTELDLPRPCWVHVPAAYDGSVPAALVVLNDGAGYLDPDDDLRAGVVLDNLVHRGDLPVAIGVFVEPAAGEGVDARTARRAEYDAPDDRYVTSLVEEVLSAVTRRWSVTEDHDRWAIGGFSSGGSAAFTAAWHRPDVFRRVLCSLPSFAQIRGGNPYPALVPATTRKPLKVFVQQGHRDLGWDEPEDNWFAQNLRVVAALAEAGYDVRLVLGEGGHDPNHGGVLLPDALRWLFADPPAATT